MIVTVNNEPKTTLLQDVKPGTAVRIVARIREPRTDESMPPEMMAGPQPPHHEQLVDSIDDGVCMVADLHNYRNSDTPGFDQPNKGDILVVSLSSGRAEFRSPRSRVIEFESRVTVSN